MYHDDVFTCTSRRRQGTPPSPASPDRGQRKSRGRMGFGQRSSKVWEQRDRLPILPLRSGWCVPFALPDQQSGLPRSVSSASGMGAGKVSSRVSMSSFDPWYKAEFVVQVLVPQPARRLVLIASPFRVFNYTDVPLALVFRGPDGGELAFPPAVQAAATVPADQLGSEQPIDPRHLGLPASPLQRLLHSPVGPRPGPGGEELQRWELPSNSFCCVPLPEVLREEGAVSETGFRFCGGVGDGEEAWSPWIKIHIYIYIYMYIC